MPNTDTTYASTSKVTFDALVCFASHLPTAALMEAKCDFTEKRNAAREGSMERYVAAIYVMATQEALVRQSERLSK